MNYRMILAISLTLLLAITFSSVSTTGAAGPAQDNPPTRSITVTGYGEATGTPDVAYMSIGVETTDTEIGVALATNTTQVEAVMTALENAGIAPDAIQTEFFNIFQERNMGMPPMDPSTSSMSGEGPENQSMYRVINVMNVRIADVDNVATILTTVVDAGANVINNVRFDLEDRDALLADARIDALADARARAEQLASELGVELGEVLTVREGGNAGVPFAAESAGRGGGGGFSEGTLQVNTSLTITFAIQ